MLTNVFSCKRIEYCLKNDLIGTDRNDENFLKFSMRNSKKKKCSAIMHWSIKKMNFGLLICKNFKWNLLMSISHNGKRIGEVADKLDEKFNLAVT